MRRPLVFLAFSLLSACTVGPDYHASAPATPAQWSGMAGSPQDKAVAATAAQPADMAWWKHFKDPQLDALIGQAEQNNHDYKVALLRVRKARAERVATAAALYPQVTAGVNGSRGNQQNIFNGKPFGLYDANFDASWELDLFGGNRRRAEAAEASAEESEAQARGALVTLRSEVARTYFELRNLQAQLRLTRDTATSQQETWKLTQEMHNAGTVSDLDATQAEAQYQGTHARVPEMEAQVSATKNQLAVLLGVQPEQLSSALNEEKPVPVADAAVVVATPADVVRQRPDVAAAERELASKTALEGAAIAAQFPKISLSALFGRMDVTFGTGVATQEWAASGGILAPILDAGRIRANIHSSEADAQAAQENYQQTVLKALSEVETALTNYLKEDEKRASLKAAADAAAMSAKLARERYQKGLDPFINVLNAEHVEFDAESTLAASEAAVSENLVALYKALGV